MQPKLSKSQYIKGLKCQLSLWFSRAAANDNSRGARQEVSRGLQAQRDMGEKIGQLAKERIPGGVEVTADYLDVTGGERQTKDFIANGETVIYEATAINPADGTYCRIDILEKVPGKDQWDMIEVKSGTSVKDSYRDDIAFQRRVFEAAGYNIRNSLIMHIDPGYVRKGDIDVAYLFKMNNVSRSLSGRNATMDAKIPELLRVIDSPAPPAAHCDSPDCPHCAKDLPLYSVFNAYSNKEAAEVFKKIGSADITKIPDALKPTYEPKRAELESHLSGQPHIDRVKLQEFVGKVEYPVYYLDYETVASAIPLYDGSRPYQQVPFQFSLHVQEQPGGALTHVGFLHKENTDPRRAFIEALITVCGDKGSVIVYNQEFEEKRNQELARDFPEYAEELNAISARMIDLYKPFQQRWLYHPDQNGSASIKTVLPTYTDISYKGMAIANGEVAYLEYLDFVTGVKNDPAEVAALWDGLEKYCGLDTYAMVALLEKLQDIAAQPEGTPLPKIEHAPK